MVTNLNAHINCMIFCTAFSNFNVFATKINRRHHLGLDKYDDLPAKIIFRTPVKNFGCLDNAAANVIVVVVACR